MPTVTPAPMPKLQFFNNSGSVLSGGKVYTYEPGSTTEKVTYTDSTGLIANANPVVLDSSGRASIWIDGTVKFIVKTSADVTLYTVDNIPEYETTGGTVSQWQASGFTPTYISATSFSVPGDQTSSFPTGDRIKSTNTGGTIYSTIVSSAYTSLTTVTVINDSGSLDSGLSVVELSIIKVTNPALPVFPVVTKTDSYVMTAADVNKTFIANKATAIAFTLVAANAVPSGTRIEFKNIGAGLLTLTGTVSINGTSTSNPTAVQHAVIRIWSDGTTWYGEAFSPTAAVNAVPVQAASLNTPFGPSFSAYRNTSNQTLTGSGTVDEIIFNAEEWDLGSCYDITTGRFTPNVAGKYFVLAQIMQSGVTAAKTSILRISKNGTQVKTFSWTAGTSDSEPFFGAAIIDCNGTTDYISIRYSVSETSSIPTVVADQATSYFQGYRIF